LVLVSRPQCGNRHFSGVARQDKKGCCAEEIDLIKIKNVAVLVISTDKINNVDSQ
jgi:hypothetical protein